MPLLVVCFVLFFGMAELYPLVEGITVPMPVFIVVGFLLAIASNYNQPAGLPWRIKGKSVERSPDITGANIQQPGVPITNAIAQPVADADAIDANRSSVHAAPSANPVAAQVSTPLRKSPQLPNLTRSSHHNR